MNAKNVWWRHFLLESHVYFGCKKYFVLVREKVCRLTKWTTPCCPTVKSCEGENIPTSNRNCLLREEIPPCGPLCGLFMVDGDLLGFVLAIGEFEALA